MVRDERHGGGTNEKGWLETLIANAPLRLWTTPVNANATS